MDNCALVTEIDETPVAFRLAEGIDNWLFRNGGRFSWSHSFIKNPRSCHHFGGDGSVSTIVPSDRNIFLFRMMLIVVLSSSVSIFVATVEGRISGAGVWRIGSNLFLEEVFTRCVFSNSYGEFLGRVFVCGNICVYYS